MVDDDTWPPKKLKGFFPLLLVYYQGHHSSNQVTAIAKLMQTGEITSLVDADKPAGVMRHPKPANHKTLQEFLNVTMVTKEFEEILAPLENSDTPLFILVEGTPGIGKSVLLKEIAYHWDKNIY